MSEVNPPTCRECDQEIDSGQEAYSVRPAIIVYDDRSETHLKRPSDKPVGIICAPCWESGEEP